MKKALIPVLALIFIISLLFSSGCKFLLRDAGSGPQGPSVETVTPEKTTESNDQKSEDPDNTPELAIRDFELSALLEELNLSISLLVDKVLPSVVNISVLTDIQEQSGGVGSGIIYNSEGYIITNSHVAGSAVELIVTLYDGSNHPAELIGFSDMVDIAVIKIEVEGLVPAEFASIDDQKVGEVVIAVGSPFGIEQSVTMGIISGKGRSVPVTTDTIPIVDLIQTDTAINPGNSGGPLINTRGEVIGINTLILSPTGASAGIGFSIPTDTAVNIAKQIMEYGRAVIPFIGVQMGFNVSEIPGVLIDATVEDSPAEKAGLFAGDLMVKYRDKELKDPLDLLTQIIRSNCNDIVEVEIFRDGQYQTIILELLECPVDF
ncbi:MAG: trypsin-like peptidase domain-containing protein [Candidatus Humimicrobiaceae bacterium]